MITGDIKAKVDRIWEVFWTGGITNPLSVIEQITYLLFIKGLDDLQKKRDRKAQLLGKQTESPLFREDQQHLRWSVFKERDPQEMFRIVSEEVFPFIKEVNGNANTSFARYMSSAVFMIPTPQLLDRVVTMLDEIPMDNRDTKGDLYEYLLSKIATSGTNGQFRTPRHIIEMIVHMVKPGPEDTIIDPASGSAGFLVSAADYIRKHHEDAFLDEAFVDRFHQKMFYGNDMDPTMLRIGAMNMVLHGIDRPNIEYRDSLSEANIDKESYTLVLANPPFKGSLDADSVAATLSRIVNTKKTELLFLALFLRILKTGGRCACIVPDGVLSNSSKAHRDIRKEIIDHHRLEAIISMPSGVFKPYAGVSTAILIFTKTGTGGTDQVWFYDMKADGYSLDDKRTPLDPNRHEQNNIPDILYRFDHLDEEKKRNRSDQSFFVPVEEIRENQYDLSINRYQEVVYEEMDYPHPREIIQSLKELEKEIQEGLAELEGMVW